MIIPEIENPDAVIFAYRCDCGGLRHKCDILRLFDARRWSKAWKRAAKKYRKYHKVRPFHLFLGDKLDEARYWARKMKRERDMVLLAYEDTRNQMHMNAAKILSREAIIEGMSEDYDILLKVAKAAGKILSKGLYADPCGEGYRLAKTLREAREAGLLGD